MTVEAVCFDDAEKALAYLETASFPIVLKADGLALGKGVLICNTLEEAKAEYENYKGSTSNSPAQRANYYKKVIASYEEGYVEEATRAFYQTIIRLGDVAIVSFPFELFSEIGLRIKTASDIPYVLSLALANGSSGYFATESDLCRGGYEIIMSRTANVQAYAPNADGYVVTGTVENLKKTED